MLGESMIQAKSMSEKKYMIENKIVPRINTKSEPCSKMTPTLPLLPSPNLLAMMICIPMAKPAAMVVNTK